MTARAYQPRLIDPCELRLVPPDNDFNYYLGNRTRQAEDYTGHMEARGYTPELLAEIDWQSFHDMHMLERRRMRWFTPAEEVEVRFLAERKVRRRMGTVLLGLA